MVRTDENSLRSHAVSHELRNAERYRLPETPIRMTLTVSTDKGAGECCHSSSAMGAIGSQSLRYTEKRLRHTYSPIQTFLCEAYIHLHQLSS